MGSRKIGIKLIHVTKLALAICTAPLSPKPRSRMPHLSFFDLRAGSGVLFCTGLVPIAYYTLIDKGLKTVQVFRS